MTARTGPTSRRVRPAGTDPAYSPDGTQIVSESGIQVMSADGGPDTVVTSSGIEPDWQPIPINAYPRPVGATPLRVSLVTAYDECTAPNRTHGPPLDSPSCNPPTQIIGPSHGRDRRLERKGGPLRELPAVEDDRRQPRNARRRGRRGDRLLLQRRAHERARPTTPASCAPRSRCRSPTRTTPRTRADRAPPPRRTSPSTSMPPAPSSPTPRRTRSARPPPPPMP